MFVAPFVVALALVPAEKRIAEIPLPAPPVIKGGAFRPAAAVMLGGKRPLGAPAMPGVGVPAVVAVGGPGDENVVKTARIVTTDDGLLAFIRKRTPPAPSRPVIAELIKKLSGENVGERDLAQAELTALGQAAVPLLRTAANNVDDVEGSTRARQALANIEGLAGANLVTHIVRLLATRKPAGAAEALIGYLPFAEDEPTFQEVELALVAVAIRDGKPDPALVRALKDSLPLRRGTAAQVICQAGGSAHHAAIRPLLKDDRASVRLRAALGLVGAYDAEAIPVLIDLLQDLTPRLRNQAEEYLTQLAGEWAVAGPKGNDLMSRRLRRDVWAAWWKNTDGARLLDEFKSRTTNDEELTRIIGLIAKLNDDKAEVRDTAMNDLTAIGKSAASLLRRAVNDGHPKIAPIAARCLETIEKDAPSPLPVAAPRLLALRKPEGTVETLLRYLPYCESVEAAEQFIDILSAVGITAGKADEVLIKGLDDTIAARRASAAVALCRGKAMLQVPAIRRLLKDADHNVQLRAAQGLAMLGEKESIPTLIALLRELPLEQVWDVEDYLSQVAGDKTPTEVVTADPASRTKAVDAWSKWWKENGEKIDLVRIEATRRESGFYLVVENWNPMLGRGRVFETDGTGKIRWEIRDLQWPNDAQVLKGGNVLIVEQQQRLTERDRTGKIVGVNITLPNVFHAERLRDGTTFVACRNALMIVDAKGTPSFNHSYTSNSILAAKRFRDGSMAYVSYSGHYVRLDRTGKQVKTMNLNWWNFSPNGAEILWGDRVIVAESRFNKVVEFGPDGKQVWENNSIMYPLIPYVMQNGNVVLAGNSNQAIYELDRKGKIVKEWKGFTFKPYRVIRR